VKPPPKPIQHQPVPELAKALAMPPEKRCRKTNKTARKTNGWAMGVRAVTH